MTAQGSREHRCREQRGRAQGRRVRNWRGLAAALLVALCGPCTSALAAELRPLPDAPSTVLPTDARLVLLDFWASWCAPCRQSFPFMQSMQQRYAAQGLQVVAISLDARAEDARRFLAQRELDFALWHDPQARLVVDYPVQVMPTSFLLDAQGRVLHRHSGFRAADAAPLEARIRYYLATGTAPAAAGAQASAPVPAQASEERRR